MNEIVINGMTIVDNLDDVNLANTIIGDQILILEKHKLLNLERSYNNISTVFLTERLFNCLYTFEGVNTNTELYEHESDDTDYDDDDKEIVYEINGSNYDSKDFLQSYLVLNENIKMRVKYTHSRTIDKEDLEGWENTIDNPYDNKKYVLYKLKEMANTSYKKVKVTQLTSEKTNLFGLYTLVVIPIGDDYLCYTMVNKINTSHFTWAKYNELYIINKEFTKYITIECDEIELFQKIKTLGCARNSYQFDDLINIYIPAYRYDINDYLKNPAGIKNVYTAFRSLYGLSKDAINKYYYPIFVDDSIGFKAYLSSVSNKWNYNIQYEYDYEKCGHVFDKSGPLEKDIRKANAILKQLKQDSMIDIYTGKRNNTSNKVLYKDAGGFILQSNNRYYYYTKLDDLFVIATPKEKESILERQKLVITMTQEP